MSNIRSRRTAGSLMPADARSRRGADALITRTADPDDARQHVRPGRAVAVGEPGHNRIRHGKSRQGAWRYRRCRDSIAAGVAGPPAVRDLKPLAKQYVARICASREDTHMTMRLPLNLAICALSV